MAGINHVVLKVRSLDVSDRFYSGILELQRVGERPGMRFYSAGQHHHDLALVEIGDKAPPPPSRATGLFHFCLNVSDEASLKTLAKRIKEAGAPFLGGVDHITMRSFYTADPDGNVVEIGVDIPEKEWVVKNNPYLTDRPYDPLT